MKRSIGIWQLIGFGVSTLGGTLLHFLYEWTDRSPLAAPFSGVNESTWEHMKLLFFPMLAYAFVQSLFFKERGDFWCVKLRGILLGLFLIPVIFYTYNGVIGTSPDWINIAIFFVSAAIVYIYEALRFKKGDVKCAHPKIAASILLLIAVFFVIFTFKTPEIGIFEDPITGEFGV
ncbi:MAG: hypothetical protein IJZ03_03710 [Clostridia bacterium]|nr:hypothetical protein [Clostridia bacterium]MBQ9749609.1 hypothetical protein [Clostridia bacterium]